MSSIGIECTAETGRVERTVDFPLPVAPITLWSESIDCCESMKSEGEGLRGVSDNHGEVKTTKHKRYGHLGGILLQRLLKGREFRFALRKVYEHHHLVLWCTSS